MKSEIKKYIKLMSGLFLSSFGVVTILQSDLGLSPWDVFHQGFSRQTGLTLGQASIIVGAVVILMGLYFKQPIGSGTILNMIFVGLFIDFFIYLDLIPRGESYLYKGIIFILGMMIFSLGCYMYISVGLGCGPRDGLMVVLTKRTGWPLGRIRFAMEFLAMTFGYILGGDVFVGTFLFSLLAGYMIQICFKIFKTDVNDIEHRSIFKEIRMLRNKLHIQRKV